MHYATKFDIIDTRFYDVKQVATATLTHFFVRSRVYISRGV